MTKRLEWPAATVKMVPIERILPYENNPRTHPEAQIDLIASSMMTSGVTQPILVDEDGVIIAGHGRRLAAIKNGFKTFPVVVARGWTEQQKRAERIQDNAYAALSGWDAKLIHSEIIQLKAEGYSLEMLGFGDVQLRGWDVLIGNDTGNDPEETPEPPKNPISRPGDLWILGDHRLLCGDATSQADVTKCLGGAKPHLMVTDPPYGVSFKRGQFVGPTKKAKGRVFDPISNDGLTGDKLRDFMRQIIEVAFSDRDGVFYVWSSFHEGHTLKEALEDESIRVQSQIIWSKTPFVLGSADYHWQHEACLYGFRGKRHPWYGGRQQGTVWQIPKPQKMNEHPTQKPIECMKRPIENNSKKGDSVYDPFAGSGTTAIACEMTGRRAFMLEIDPAYCDVIAQRWELFTGEKAIRRPAEGTHAPKRKGRPEAALPKKAAPKGSAKPPNSAMRGRLSPSGASSRPRGPVAER